MATAADLAAVMELAGWTNDRLVQTRINRLAPAEWVYGRPNSSVVMAAFLHVAPGGMRFNGPELGAWYAADALATAAAEVAHHLRREATASGLEGLGRTYRAYGCVLEGSYLDLRGRQAERADVYASEDYAAGQALGEEIRAAGGDGVVYDSLRRQGGVNAAAHRPRNVTAVQQAGHYQINVTAAGRRIEVRRLSG